MVSYRRIYEDRIKRYLTKTGVVGVSLIFGLFMMLSAQGDITITGFSGDQQCAGTDYDPCYAYLNFTAETDIYVYPTNETTWMFNVTPINSMESIVMQRSWGTGWRTIDLSKPWSSKVKYAVKFSKGKDYEIRFVGYKKNINETVKWGFGFADGNYSENTKSYVDPAWTGYNKDSFFTELTDYKAGFTSGYAEFVITNPLGKDIEINESNLKSLYTVVQGKVLSEQYTFYSVIATKTIKTNKTICTDNFVLKQLIITNNVTGLNETTEQEVNEPICETVKVDKIVPAKKEKKTLGVVIPKKGNLTFRIDLTYEPNTIVDWIPELEIDGTKFKQDKWLWFNSTRDFKRPIVIEGIGLSMPDNYQKLLNIDYDTDMQTDFSDILLTWLNTTDSEEYQIDYWVESQNDGVDVTVWVEIPVIYNETTNTTIYIYYGNNSGSVSSESNVYDVMLSYDLFDDASINSSIWSTHGGNGGVITESAGEMQHSGDSNWWGSNSFTKTNFRLTDNITIEFDVRYPSYYGGGGGNGFAIYLFNDTTVTWGAVTYYDAPTSTNFGSFSLVCDCAYDTSIQVNIRDNGTYDAWLMSGTQYMGNVTGGTISSWANVEDYYNVDLTSAIYSARTRYFDNFRIRKYTPTEPTYTVGAEEIQGESDINWSIWIGSGWANASDYYTDFRCLPTQTNCEPTDQDAASNQCIYKICNNGTADATSLKMNLTSTCPNMDFKADDDYTSVDATILTTTLQEVHGALAQNSCVEICMWADYNNPDTCSAYPEPYAELS